MDCATCENEWKMLAEAFQSTPPKGRARWSGSRPQSKTAKRMPINVSIVEDSDKFRETLARVLNRSEGFRCISQYPNAEDALKALPQDKPDVVLMDINLPGINGVECVRQLKQ